MSDVQKVHQRLPPDFAATLVRFASDESGDRLDSLLACAKANGWTLTALAEPFGWTREWVRQRVGRARPAADLPVVPLPPRRPTPMPRTRRRLTLSADAAAELREMQAVATTVNGAAAREDPRRRVSEQLTAQLAAFVKQGVTVYHLAQVLGVTYGAIAARLARHGYRVPTPSQESDVYRNRKVGEAARKDACRNGHDLTGDNLRITKPGGVRVCRTCERDRAAAYRERKANSTSKAAA